MTFEKWLEELNTIARAYGFKGAPIVEQTGAECWRECYDEGLTPREALMNEGLHAE